MKFQTAISNACGHKTSKRILFLDNLRAVAILMVVGDHTLGYCIPLPEQQKHIVSIIVHTISVPIFFLVDGYLFARDTTYLKKNDYLLTIKKSIFRLILPWTIFSSFYAITRFFFELSGFLTNKIIIGHSFAEITLSTYGSIIASQMYFLLSLFLIRLCGPIFKFLANLHYFMLTIVFFCYSLTYTLCIDTITPYLEIDGGQEPILHALWGINYYLLGILLIKLSKSKYKATLSFSFIFLMSYMLLKDDYPQLGSLFIQYFYLVTSFSLFFYLNTKTSFLETVGKNTMGIYLVHAPVLLKANSMIINNLVIPPILNYILLSATTFSLSFFVVVILKSIPFGQVLFGESQSITLSSE